MIRYCPGLVASVLRHGRAHQKQIRTLPMIRVGCDSEIALLESDSVLTSSRKEFAYANHSTWQEFADEQPARVRLLAHCVHRGSRQGLPGDRGRRPQSGGCRV